MKGKILERDSKPKELKVNTPSGFPAYSDATLSNKRVSDKLLDEEILSEISQLISPRNIEFLRKLSNQGISVTSFAKEEEEEIISPSVMDQKDHASNQTDLYDFKGRKIIDENQVVSLILQSMGYFPWSKDYNESFLKDFALQLMGKLNGSLMVCRPEDGDEAYSIDQLVRVRHCTRTELFI